MATFVKLALTLYIYNGLTVLSRYLQMCHAYTAGDIEVFASWTSWSISNILDPPVSHLFQSYDQRERGQWCLCIHSKGPGGSWTGWCIFCIFYPPTSHPPPLLVYFILTSHKSSSAPPPPPPTVCSQLVKDHECYHCLCHLQLPMP